MNVWHLALREIGHRRLHFGLAVAAVLVAVGCLVGELTLVRAHEVRAERLGADQEAAARERVARLEDDYRRITLGLGYNVLILAKDQDRGRFYAEGYAAETMPESYADRLAASDIVTVRHLLPSLQVRTEWPERKMPITLIGTRGEVPTAHRDAKQPLEPPVAKGTMVLGSVVGERSGLAVGDEAVLLGRTFTVARVHPPRGNEDDVTVWVDLAEAQALLGKPGRINAILALSCFCDEATPEGMNREIGGILDGQVQVLELSPQAAARRAARSRAVAHGTETVDAEAAARARHRLERQAFAAWVVPLVVAGCTVWVGLLALGNVRDRRGEIAILRALGVGAGRIVSIFLARAIAVGVLGAALGYAAGFGLAAAWDAARSAPGQAAGAGVLFGPALAAATLILAPLWSAAAGLVPALVAARQDPAVILREE